MKKILIIIFLSVPLPTFAQEATIESNIAYSLKNFFVHIDAINDPETPESIYAIAEKFMGTNYFKFNDQDISPMEFLSMYNQKYIGAHIINHNLEFKNFLNKDIGIWEVHAILLRTSGDDSDYHIKDTNIKFMVRFDKESRDVRILTIDFAPLLDIRYPKWKTDYVFKVPSSLSVSDKGGEVSIAIESKYRKIKTYGEEIAEEGPYHDMKYEIIEYSGFRNFDKLDITNNGIKGQIEGNPYRHDKIYKIKVQQKRENGDVCIKEIVCRQDAKSSFWSFDSYNAPKHQIEVLYSRKYDLGLSYMITIPDTRISVGAVAASNFDSYKGMFSKKKTSVKTVVNIDISGEDSFDSEVTNGYKKTKQEYDHEYYSALIDPYQEAEHFMSRSFFLAQCGIYPCQWLRFDLGVGVAREQNVHYMKNKYNVVRYSYEPISDEYLPIDDIYSYSRTDQEKYYRDATRWRMAIRPSINGQIPLDGWHETFITVGIGYLYAFNMSGANSFDCSIGFGCNF
ncbi:MAG: hypothetical protein IKD24_02780 [Alistipes sp.]|nr:hypothetical protein [Alistipes sp.]